MSTAADVPVLSADPTVSERRVGVARWPHHAWRFCRRKPLGAIGGFIVVVMLFVAIFVDAALVAATPAARPTGYNAQVFGEENPSASLNIPWYGPVRHDILSRVHGIRISTVIDLAPIAVRCRCCWAPCRGTWAAG
jgi:hypothetical protein